MLGTITFFSLILALLCITQPFNPLSQFIFPAVTVGRCAAGAAYSGAFLCPDVDRVVIDRFLSLYLVALYLHAELE